MCISCRESLGASSASAAEGMWTDRVPVDCTNSRLRIVEGGLVIEAGAGAGRGVGSVEVVQREPVVERVSEEPTPLPTPQATAQAASVPRASSPEASLLDSDFSDSPEPSAASTAASPLDILRRAVAPALADTVLADAFETHVAALADAAKANRAMSARLRRGGRERSELRRRVWKAKQARSAVAARVAAARERHRQVTAAYAAWRTLGEPHGDTAHVDADTTATDTLAAVAQLRRLNTVVRRLCTQ